MVGEQAGSGRLFQNLGGGQLMFAGSELGFLLGPRWTRYCVS